MQGLHSGSGMSCVDKSVQTDCVGLLPPLIKIPRVVLRMKGRPERPINGSPIDREATTHTGLPLLTAMPDGVQITITGTPQTTDAKVWTLRLRGSGPAVDVEADESTVMLHPDSDEAITKYEKKCKAKKAKRAKKIEEDIVIQNNILESLQKDLCENEKNLKECLEKEEREERKKAAQTSKAESAGKTVDDARPPNVIDIDESCRVGETDKEIPTEADNESNEPADAMLRVDAVTDGDEDDDVIVVPSHVVADDPGGTEKNDVVDLNSSDDDEPAARPHLISPPVSRGVAKVRKRVYSSVQRKDEPCGRGHLKAETILTLLFIKNKVVEPGVDRSVYGVKDSILYHTLMVGVPADWTPTQKSIDKMFRNKYRLQCQWKDEIGGNIYKTPNAATRRFLQESRTEYNARTAFYLPYKGAWMTEREILG